MPSTHQSVYKGTTIPFRFVKMEQLLATLPSCICTKIGCGFSGKYPLFCISFKKVAIACVATVQVWSYQSKPFTTFTLAIEHQEHND